MALDVGQQLMPALCALTQADQFFRAIWCRDDHQHTLGILLHPGLKIDAVRPDVDIVTGSKITPGLGVILCLPS